MLTSYEVNNCILFRFFENDSFFPFFSLLIPKGYAESVNQRRTDNTMTTRKKDKRANNDLQNITHLTGRESVQVNHYGTSVSQMTMDMFHLS
jgi:hypothetical protein